MVQNVSSIGNVAPFFVEQASCLFLRMVQEVRSNKFSQLNSVFCRMPSGDSSGAPVYYHCSTSLLLKFTKVCCTSFESRFGADDGSFARRTSELDPAGKARKCDRRRQHFCQPAAIWANRRFSRLSSEFGARSAVVRTSWG